ncbi:MAG: (2Fe-2S)-binding protein [Blautia sp.]|nr:(2Fe-2S)-binding protein [Blautia sp.]
MGGTMIINGNPVEFTDEKNVLAVIHKAGIDMPTLCYYSELSTYGACRMCVVEDSRGKIESSCSMEPRDGLEIRTNTKRLLSYRQMILELLLSAHDCNCTVCGKSGACRLQSLAFKYGVRSVRFQDTRPRLPEDTSSFSIVRNPNKCILCGDCVRVCSEIQGMGILDFVNRGSEARVQPAFNMDLSETNCIGCGQCAAVCPTNAIRIKRNIMDAWDAIFDPNTRVIAQIAPAVRVALGEAFHLPPGENTLAKVVSALKAMGFDYVTDTTLGADFTVMEEAAEFMERVKNGGPFPMFTSCCPAWVKYCEKSDPDLLQNISTCKSPMGMFSPVLKRYYDEKVPSKKRTVVVAIMPCTAKKMEAARDEFKTDGIPDTDVVLTTQELIAMINEAGVNFDKLVDYAPDMPMGLGSGAGVIFGTTGGVAEAVVRRCMNDHKRYLSSEKVELMAVRGFEDVKEATVEVEGQEIRIAVVHGMREAQKLIASVRAGERSYHLIEVMACKGGCVGGAGQPYGLTAVKKERAKGLYKADHISGIRSSDENPIIGYLYDEVVKDHRHEMLHVHYKRPE